MNQGKIDGFYVGPGWGHYCFGTLCSAEFGGHFQALFAITRKFNKKAVRTIR